VAGLGVLVLPLLTLVTKILLLLGFSLLNLLSSLLPLQVPATGLPVLVVRLNSTNGFNLPKVLLPVVPPTAGRVPMLLTLLVQPLSMVWPTIGNPSTMIPRPTSGVSRSIPSLCLPGSFS
jgi:hypothetical protein